MYVDPVQVTSTAVSAVDDHTGPVHEEALQQSGMNGGGTPGALSLPTKLFATDRFGERRESFVNPLLTPSLHWVVPAQLRYRRTWLN